MPQPWPWFKVKKKVIQYICRANTFLVPNNLGVAQTDLVWEAAAAAATADADAAAETNWKYKVSPDRGD